MLAALANGGAGRPRVVVSTDIGGTDPDDYQSMVHLLLYADALDIEGLISSPYGPGRARHIHEVLDRYERDYAALRRHSAVYPAPDALRAIVKQGALESPGPAGVGEATEGSNWIVTCARRRDPRPLYVLVWGGIEDLAQALRDAPDILPKLRVYFIGGPNKMWSVNAYHYVEQRHPKLWMIEANATYRGWFTGGDQTGEWGNTAFPARHIAGRGALGEFFMTQLKGVIKMGDTPSVMYLLHGDPERPDRPGWGGQFARVWDARLTVFDRMTTAADTAEVFGVVEFRLPAPANAAGARAVFDNRVAIPGAVEGGRLVFRFAPRDAKVWNYRIEAGGETREGQFTAAPPAKEKTARASRVHPNWWIDDPRPEAAEGIHPGARSVNRWRREFLADFAARFRRVTATE